MIPVLRSLGLLRMPWFSVVPRGGVWGCDCHAAGREAIAPAGCMERGVQRLRRVHQISASQGEFFGRHGQWKDRRHERPADRAWGTRGHGHCSTDILIILRYLPSFLQAGLCQRGPRCYMFYGFLFSCPIFPSGRPGMTEPMASKAPVDQLHGRRSDLSQHKACDQMTRPWNLWSQVSAWHGLAMAMPMLVLMQRQCRILVMLVDVG